MRGKNVDKPEPPFKIRPARRSNQKIIRSLIFLGDKLPLDRLKNRLWILQLSSEVVGVAGLEVYGNQGLLRSVTVIKGKRNQGYGAALANYGIGEAKKSRVQLIFADNKAQGFSF